MKALTITQPWAWAIVDLDVAHLPAGLFPKRIENREWFLGRMTGKQFAIHSSKNSYDSEGAGWMEGHGYLTPQTLSQAPTFNLRGHILGLARIDRVIHAEHEDPMLHDPWFCGSYGLVLRDVIRLSTPIPARGYQRWWDVAHANLERIREQPRVSVPNW